MRCGKFGGKISTLSVAIIGSNSWVIYRVIGNIFWGNVLLCHSSVTIKHRCNRIQFLHEGREECYKDRLRECPREAGLDRLNSFIRSLRVKNIQYNSDLRSLFIDCSWICSSFEAWKWIFLAAGAAQRKRRDWKWRMKNLRALAAKAVLPLTKYFLENLIRGYL